MDKIDEKQLHQIIHGIGVMALAGSLMDDSHKQVSKSRDLILMAAIVLVMHNGPNVINDLVEEEAETLHQILGKLTEE